MLGSPSFVSSFSSSEARALQEFCGYVPNSGMEFFRFILDGQVYHSSSYTGAKKTNSSVIKSSAASEFYRIEGVIKFTRNNVEKCVLLCKEIIISESLSVNFPGHIKEATLSPLAVFRAIDHSDIVCPVLFTHFPTCEKSYVCKLPNVIERD